MQRLLIFALLAAPIGAQQKLDARAFVPADYRAEVFMDFAAVRDCGLWEQLTHSLFGPFLQMGEKGMGFAFDDVTRVHFFPGLPDPDAQGPDSVIATWEGSDALDVQNFESRSGHSVQQVGAFEVMVQTENGGSDPDAWVKAKPGLVVYGSSRLVLPVLEGKAKAGVPSGEFLSLLATRGDLAHVVLELTPKILGDMPPFVPRVDWPAEDQPKYLVLRLRQEAAKTTGDDPNIVLEGVVRCATGAKCPALIQGLLTEALQEAQKNPQLRLLRPLFTKVEFKIDGRDLIARLPLGRPRDAAGSLSYWSVPMIGVFTLRAAAVQAQAVQIQVQAQAQAQVQVEAAPAVEEKKGPVPEKPKQPEKPAEKKVEKPAGNGGGVAPLLAPAHGAH